jgi:peptidoglycan/LPS O-acetylase OafA/YrhL
VKSATDHLQTSTGRPRLGALDSLRGLASLAVLLGHTLAVCQWDSEFSRWLFINNLFDGRSAVTMFFVLSGFVLTMGHLSEARRPLYLIPFYARRITRIWLPWFAFFLISFVAKTYLRFPFPETIPSITAHHASFWSQDMTFIDILKQMVFQLHNSKRMLLPQDWSLGVELRASLLIPLFLLIVRKNWAILTLAALALPWLKPSGGYYYASFAIGVLAAHLNSKTEHIPNGTLMLLFGILLYQARWIFDVTEALPFFMNEREVWFLGSAGCGLIILGTLKCMKFRKILEHSLLAHLGRVSYSLYLVQVIVLLCLAPWIVVALNSVGIHSEAWLQVLLLVIVAGVCLVLADIGERWIEVPCIRLGKLVTRRLERSTVVKMVKI